MCEKGLENEDWVNFDQTNNAVLEEWTFIEALFWKEISFMEIVDLMSGAKGEKSHHLYK